MKRTVKSITKIFLTGLLSVTFSFITFAEKFSGSEFKSPPNNVKIHTWWHWVDGNVTREGITKDMEAMKDQGIVQATIFNVGVLGEKDFGIERVVSNSPEWFDLFQWALKEANRLGIFIGIHNCDGWSTSGGPWITPEMSMKRYTWTKTIINASSSGLVKLRKPLANHDFYKDVAVVGIRTAGLLNSFQKAAPAVLLEDSTAAKNIADGCQVSAYNLAIGSHVTFQFPQKFSAEKIVILPRRSFMWGDPNKFISYYSISVSDDGKNFKKIHEFQINGLNKINSILIPTTSAKYFQLTLTDTNHMEDWFPVTIAECEILTKDEIPLFSPEIEYFSQKTGDLEAAEEACFNLEQVNHRLQTEKEVTDLTGYLKADGTLEWKPSDGNWTIIRFGYTTTGAVNSPATEAGTGLECDKMDTTALNVHFRSFPAKLVEKAGIYAGNTFKFMLIDSWECGFQNWTAAFPSEFKKRRGYSLIPYIPVLCGESSGSSETDNAVLYDFRKTIAELVENNYYRHFSDLLHQKNIELHAEVIYGNGGYPALDILKTTQYIDLPMYEFWSSFGKDPDLKYQPKSRVVLNMPSCAAIGYEKQVLAAEAYTGWAHYSESPASLKPFGNLAYCTGINQMILHSYVHQPTDNKPGMTLGQFGSHFNRNNSYWPFISEWFTFQARIQYILQQGVASHDVLYYLGDQLPQYLEYNQSNTLPFGYMMNACNFDILKNRIEIVDGKIILNGKTAYSLLSLSPNPYMTFETLLRIGDLVEGGAIVYGPKPMQMLSLSDIKNHKKQFDDLATKIWGKPEGQSATERAYGKGKVYWGMPISEVLKKQGILPEVVTGVDDANNLVYFHKKAGNQDIYFVANQRNSELRREISFRVPGKTPEIWDPEYGTVTYPAVYMTDAKYITLPVSLKPYESLIFVFSDKKSGEYISVIRQNGKQIFPGANKENPEQVPEIIFSNGKLVCRSEGDSDADLITSRNKAIKLVPAKKKEFVINDFSGKIEFDPPFTASIKPVNFSEFNWLTESADPDVKYFSGTARYSIFFKLPASEITSADSVMLDLGNFESIAEVKMNGKILGRLWNPGKLMNVKGLLKDSNILEVSVANTFRNRFIGDYIQHGKVQNLWTSAPIADFLNKELSLQPSGLKGPVRIISLTGQVLE